MTSMAGIEDEGARDRQWATRFPSDWAAADPGRVKLSKGRSPQESCPPGPRFPSCLAIACQDIGAGKEGRSTCSSRPSVLTRPRPKRDLEVADAVNRSNPSLVSLRLHGQGSRQQWPCRPHCRTELNSLGSWHQKGGDRVNVRHAVIEEYEHISLGFDPPAGRQLLNGARRTFPRGPR